MVAVARQIAVNVLMRVAKDGAFAAASLDAEIRRSKAESRDANLATQIVYGTLRVMPELDEWIGQATKKGKVKDGLVLAVLRASGFQLRHLDRVPPHAVVNDAVALVRNKRGSRMGGFTNAVLRKMTSSQPKERKPPRALAVEPWLRAELVASVGEERAATFLDVRPLPPPIGLRTLSGTERLDIQQSLEKLGAVVRPGTLSDQCLLVTGLDPRKTKEFDAGAYVVQEQGAQLITERIGAKTGEHVLDACAGRGGKTLRLLEMVGTEGHVTALDLHESKLDQLTEKATSLGFGNRLSTESVDLTVGDGGLQPKFDRVVVDAPCSGLGTIHRRPEILLRLKESDLARFHALQCQILSRAATLVRPGGELFFAVCSFARAEGVEVRDWFLEQDPKFSTIELDGEKDDGLLIIGPWMDDADAYQVAAFRKSL